MREWRGRKLRSLQSACSCVSEHRAQRCSEFIEHAKGLLRLSAAKAQFLAKTSVKKIALITLDSDQTQMIERQSGYLAAVKKYRIKPLILKVPFENDTESTIEQSVRFIKDNPGLDSIIFATNYLALSGIKAINNLGLNIPRDISVIAFDDHDVFNIYNPSISAIAQPLDEMAKQLFKTLLDKLENRVRLKDLSKVIIHPDLILRGSTRSI